jgi:hypothetical protein
MPDVAISQNLKVGFTETQWNALKSALFAGRKIEALRMVRKILPQAGLAEAKIYVEKIDGDLRGTQPEQFSTIRDDSREPLAWVILFVLIVAAIGWVAFLLSHK